VTGKGRPKVTDGDGDQMYRLCQTLFPICRSITGDGVRQTLSILKEKYLPELQIHETPSGAKCFDWTVPPEWNIRDAYVLDPAGKKIIDFKKCNLHVVGYSEPINKTVALEELQQHIHSLPDQPNAIPYVTSYYKRRWGFCLADEQRRSLKPGSYKVHIDSSLKPGSLTYGEFLLAGETEKEIFFSTYVCHPSMANNELSGPVVTTFLARWLQSLDRRRYSYRIIFIPETIGSILYLSQNLEIMKKNLIAGFNVTCVGDDRAYSYVPTRKGDTLADVAAQHVLKHTAPDFRHYSYLESGSDERQYCSPGVDLPVASIMRSKYWEYPEYHTSLDNLEIISPQGLSGGLSALQKCAQVIEKNEFLKTTILCEPQLGKRGLYPNLSTKKSFAQTRVMMNLLAYADGTASLLDIAEITGTPIWEFYPIVEKLKNERLLTAIC